jgi:ribonuclease BN (tRNA processing enzyme)
VRLTVLGSSGTYPTPGRPASGYLVDHAGTTVWLDVGPGTLPALMAGPGVGVVDAIVLSHVHPDHCADLFPLLNVLRYGAGSGTGLPVLCPPGLPERFGDFLGAGQGHALYRIFAFDEVGPGDERTVGPMTLRFGEANHPVPALVTRIEADGLSLVYSGDTGPGGDLSALAAGADLLLCEATMQGEVPDRRYEFHLFACEAGEVAAGAGVGRLVVTHIAPTLDPSVTVAEAAATFGGPVTHAVPGSRIDVAEDIT